MAKQPVSDPSATSGSTSARSMKLPFGKKSAAPLAGARSGAAKSSGGAGGKGAGGKGAAKAPKVKKVRLAKSKQIVQAYKMLKPRDPSLPWWMLLSGIGTAAVLYALMLLLFDNLWLPILPAVMFGVLAALFVFSFRARRTSFAQAEGQTGAAAWSMKNMRGDWRITEGVAGTSQADLVHRVLGRPGIVLVAEGSPQRVKGLIAQEKKRLARVIGETPIYDLTVGDGKNGTVTLKKLNTTIMKLPRNIPAAQVRTLDKRLKAVGAPKMPMPQGPLPKGKSMSVNSRALRRRG